MREILEGIAALYGKSWRDMDEADCLDVMQRLKRGSVCTERCRDCRWGRWLSKASADEGNTACCYSAFPGHGLRPCPAGDDCTVFEPGRDRRARDRMTLAKRTLWRS